MGAVGDETDGNNMDVGNMDRQELLSKYDYLFTKEVLVNIVRSSMDQSEIKTAPEDESSMEMEEDSADAGSEPDNISGDVSLVGADAADPTPTLPGDESMEDPADRQFGYSQMKTSQLKQELYSKIDQLTREGVLSVLSMFQ